jgi:hypothetical protein
MVRKIREKRSQSDARNPVIAMSPSAWTKIEYALGGSYMTKNSQARIEGTRLVVTSLVEGDEIVVMEGAPKTTSKFLYHEHKKENGN